MYKHLRKRADSDKRVDLSLEVKNWHVRITATHLDRSNEYVLVLFHQYWHVSVYQDSLVKEETIFLPRFISFFLLSTFCYMVFYP